MVVCMLCVVRYVWAPHHHPSLKHHIAPRQCNRVNYNLPGLSSIDVKAI